MGKYEVKKGIIEGVLLLTPTVYKDNRGFFTETYNEKDFREIGIVDRFVQDNNSRSKKDVVRGLHFQYPPKATNKLFRCFFGEIYDVVVDLRPHSPTYKQWEAFTLSAENMNMLYIPIGLAHGFCVVSDGADVVYKVTEFFDKAYDGGIRWDDSDINVQWPTEKQILSEKDEKLPNLKDIAGRLMW